MVGNVKSASRVRKAAKEEKKDSLWTLLPAALRTWRKALACGTAKPMKIVRTPAAMARLSAAWDRPVALVPTMGALHAGHLALIDHARVAVGPPGLVAVSIFVNPLQFGPKEDLSKYPRPLRADLARCREHGVDVVFHPDAGGMYAPGAVRSRSRNRCWRAGCAGGRGRGISGGFARWWRNCSTSCGPTSPCSARRTPSSWRSSGAWCATSSSRQNPRRGNGPRAGRPRAQFAQRLPQRRGTRPGPRAAPRAAARRQTRAGGGTRRRRPARRAGTRDRHRPAGAGGLRRGRGRGRLATGAVYRGKTLLAVAVFFGRTRLIDNLVVQTRRVP